MDRVSNKQSMSFSATTSIINFRKRRRPYRKQLDSHSESKVRANETEKKARSEIYIYFFFYAFFRSASSLRPYAFLPHEANNDWWGQGEEKVEKKNIDFFDVCWRRTT